MGAGISESIQLSMDSLKTQPGEVLNIFEVTHSGFQLADSL